MANQIGRDLGGPGLVILSFVQVPRRDRCVSLMKWSAASASSCSSGSRPKIFVPLCVQRSSPGSACRSPQVAGLCVGTEFLVLHSEHARQQKSANLLAGPSSRCHRQLKCLL